MDRAIQVIALLIIGCNMSIGLCYSALEIDPQVVIAQIQQSYETLEDVKTYINQQSRSQDVQMNAQGLLHFKAPDKIKLDFEITAAHGKYRAKNLLVYDGKILWQELLNLDNKKISVLKSEMENSSVQAQEILKEFDPKQQFKDFIDNYNVINVSSRDEAGKRLYILDMEIKPSAKDRMIQLLKAKGQHQSNDMIPEKVMFYWDKDKQFASKIESYSNNQKFKMQVEYSKTEINSGINDELFLYAPPDEAEVIDMSSIMKEEIKLREFEGAQNKSVGKVFPDFKLVDIFNDEYDSKNLQGKILIVNFWEHWCPPCIKEMPLIESLYEDVYTDEYVQILTVTTNKDKAFEIVEENSYSFPVLIDEEGKLANTLGVESIPRTFVVDKQGAIAAVYMGYHPDIKETLIKDINRLNPEEE